ncbi:inter-alpha-trypsin inhibitor heavy chain H3-like [Odontesthes bonariensis]|uniref:inter-alpha-trypsin inhibitor heavy chain H3-like n=1 Tax=Odontesthes bonariensis TaxID=219752 RepID=UPI003F58BB43
MPEERPSCLPVMSTMWRVLLLWVCVCICPPAQAQGALVISKRETLTEETKEDTGTGPVKKRITSSANVDVYSVRVACTVTSRFAHTVMTSKALNKANSTQEIRFEMELPKTAFITNFSMEIDGRVYSGEVKEKEKAKKQYEKAVSSGQSAGLIKAFGRNMEKFSASVNIAAKSSVTFNLIYEELLQRKLGQYEIVTRVKIENPVQEFQILADIYEPQGITFVEASATFLTNELLPLIEKTTSDTKAHISFLPTVEQQKCPRCEGTIINGYFIVKYDVKRKQSLGEVQVVNGYFVHYFSPPDLVRIPKNVVFVIDSSGSMHGTKIRQTQEAMAAILRDLHEDDHFGIVLFDDNISTWRNSLSKATKTNVSQAINYVKKTYAGSSTDINSAVLRAVSMLRSKRQDTKLSDRSVDMIILLTDGMPNHGVSNTQMIQQNVHSAIAGNMSLFCLGFGNDVAYSFLDVMSRQNKGLARRIFEASDVVTQLKGFYEEVSSTLLFDVELHYPDNAVGSLTKNHYSHLFNGSEIVVAGQLTQNDMDNFLVEVFAQGPEGNVQVKEKASGADWHMVYPEKEYIFGDFTERLWAYLTIQQLLERSDIGSEQDKKNATAQALEMSLRYGFVTPLTSMVVTKPESDDSAGRSLIADKLTEDQRQQADRRKVSKAPSAPLYRGKGDVDGDPHFMIELPDRDDALCFNINDKPGTIFNLVRDQKSGFVVNGQIIGKKKLVPNGNNNTFFGRFGITHQKLGLRLEVSTQDISVFYNSKQVRLLWSDTTFLKDTGLDLRLTNNCSMTVTLRHSVKFLVIKHTKIWKRRHDQQEYLGFYTLDSHHLSPSVHGLLGKKTAGSQFYHGVEFEATELHPGKIQDKFDAIMYVKGQKLNVTRHWQKDFSRDVKNGEIIHCWFVTNDGRGLIDGTASDYTVSDLFTV